MFNYQLFRWYYGQLDANTASNLLMTSINQFGSFLIRQNKVTGVFSLTIRDLGTVRHYHVKKHDDGKLYISLQISFRSIYDLVKHYSLHAHGLFTKLTQPCIAPHCIEDRDEEVTFTDYLRSNQFSELWKGEWNGMLVAINKIEEGTLSQANLLNKCAFMTTLRHKNLTEFLAIYIHSEPFLVVTEYMETGNLKEFLSGDGKDMNMVELINVSSQVAAAMNYLEEKTCIHQNLAADNVMVNCHEERITCKLNVYPYVHNVSGPGKVYTSLEGTVPVRWLPYESIMNNEIDIKSNVWSFGILLWEIVNHCRTYPYPNISENRVLEKLREGYRMPHPLGCPKELYDLMNDCWEEDRSCRPTFEVLYWKLDELFTSEDLGYELIK